ncbi:GTPase-associated protein 1-related protein [Streptomyces sp. NBC_00193]|uniref:GTPase-associated protein 1-related protein n=1 Tax=Streptomyces sp. NBC_00193 TaxID=2975675 RepID=UPI002258EEBE|nr:GTPase-associated protein 1-related protein [Streptomyces sp. NBC_00193]MCX5299801.1 GTPase-associated protein 1-related protein [Streptomyces sp. NBC_00193]
MKHFQQLYYTSCEHGLSGFSGFQFNAVSPGVTAGTRQAVEALAGYEPPRSLVESDTPELLERCPVNLCYRPYDRDGRRATALCVRYVGRDSARRFGNYFAHALHSEDFREAAGGMLGIELWNSPVWTRTVAPATEIPVLAAPAPGPLGVRAVAEFLRGHPHAARLPELLAAVFAALTEHGSVVVVDHDTERIARWFAAVSYLLPPPLARGLSFATYVFRPARSRLHLIGTVPEAQLAFGTDDEAAYTVFDFSRGVFPEVPVSDLVRLLTRIGVDSVRLVWSWTADYTRGGEETPEDWHAPVAAAACAGGITLTKADAHAVIDWLAGADHLGALGATVADDIHRKHRDLDDGRLAMLSAAAKAGGDIGVHREIEGKLHASRMRAYVRSAGNAAPPVPIDDPTARERATALWERLAAEARTPRERTRLLLWAVGARLSLTREAVERETLDLAHALLASSTDELLDEVSELLRVLPVMRASLAAAVEEVLKGRSGQEQVLSHFPANLLREDDLADRPLVLEHHLRARAERIRSDTVPIMFKILKIRGRTSPDEELVSALWHPSRTWSHADAAWIARLLPAAEPVDEAVGAWFRRALGQDIQEEESLAACLRLCGLLAEPGRFAWLPADVGERVRIALDLNRALREAVEATELLEAFDVPPKLRWSATLALTNLCLVPAMLWLPVDTPRLHGRLTELSDRDLDRYLSDVHRRVTGGEGIGDVLLSHVATAATLSRRSLRTQAQLELVTAIRSHPAAHWPLADLARLEAAVRPHQPQLADHYAEDAESRRSSPQRRAGWLSRFGRSTSAAADPPGARATEPPAPDAPRPDAPRPDAPRPGTSRKKKKGQ